ncbi:MAG: hypothetical protein Q8M29_00465 [Bacteroidota bacterium]|nr:hypothetical protein [Bacteroidota bacterium]
MYTIFYSWQAILPNRTNRDFIEKSIVKSIKSLKKEDEFFVELSLDRDIQNVDGTPDIANTLFEKIRDSDLFIADVSIINRDTEGRKTPNPNVLIELGYAASCLGWENIICVFNTAYGRVEELPFDIRSRSVITYSANESDSDLQPEKNAISTKLKEVIKNFNHDRLKELRFLERHVKQINPLAYRIAITKTDNWNNSFFVEVYRSFLKEVVEKHEDYTQGVIYRKSKEIEFNEFLGWIQLEFGEIATLLEMTFKYFQNKVFTTVQNEKAIDIYNMINKLFFFINEFVEWEINIHFTIVPEEFANLHKLLLGGSKKIIGFFEEVIVQFHIAYTNNEVKKIMTFPNVFNDEEISFEMANLSQKAKSGELRKR